MATFVLVLLMSLLLAVVSGVSRTVTQTVSTVDEFSASRSAFDLMSQKLAQTTLNTYWDYDNPINPTVYYRQSDLQFLIKQNGQNAGMGQEVYFVTPEAYSTDDTIRSTQGLLNACGFYVEYGASTKFQPSAATTTRYRYRLLQGLEATEKLQVYNWSSDPPPTVTATTSASEAQSAWSAYWTQWPSLWKASGAAYPAWTGTVQNTGTSSNGDPNANVTPLADNIIALVIWPRLSTAEDPAGTKLSANYQYDSQAGAFPVNSSGSAATQPITANQLPPTIQLTVVAIGESSMAKIDTHSMTQPAAITQALPSGIFTDPTQYQTDIANVGRSLAANHISYEVLSTSITMKESKWSDNSQ